MARIKVYDQIQNPNAIPQTPRAQGSDFGAGIGRAAANMVSNAVDMVDGIQKRKIQTELSNSNAQLSELQHQYTMKWDELARTATPGDQTLADKFLEDFDNDTNKLSEGIETQEGRAHFESSRQKLRNSFEIDARNTQAELAGIKAKDDYVKTRGNLTASLISNPNNLDLNLELHDSGVDTLVNSGLLPSKKADELKFEGRAILAEASVKGWIKQDPSKTKKDIHSGKFDTYLDGNKKYQLLEEAEQEIRARKVEKERNDALFKKVQTEKVRKTQAEFQEKLISYSLTAKDVMDSELPAYGSGSKNQFINMIKRQSKAGFDASDPVVYNKIFERIHADDDDPEKIDDENELNDLMFGNGLSQDDAMFLGREIRAKKNQPESIESRMKKKVIDEAKTKMSRSNPLTGYVDENGEKQVHQFSAFIQREYDIGIKNGKSPNELLSPDSPNYLGRFMPNFQKSEKQVISEIATEKKKKEKLNGMTAQQKEAYNWANANKNDPRAKEILKRLGAF